MPRDCAAPNELFNFLELSPLLMFDVGAEKPARWNSGILFSERSWLFRRFTSHVVGQSEHRAG
jgi:hypothetical protein